MEDEGTTMFLTLVTLVAVTIVLASAVKSYTKWRGTRVIICPESGQPARVEVDAGHGRVLICAAPALSANKPDRICSLIDCSAGLRTPSVRRWAIPAKPCLKAF